MLISRFTIAGEFSSKLTHLTVGRRLSFLAMLVSPSGCSQSGFRRVTNPSERGSRWARKSPRWNPVFYNLISKVADHHFLPYSIGHTDQPWYKLGENYKVINTKRWISVEVILKDGYCSNSFSLKYEQSFWNVYSHHPYIAESSSNLRI